MLNGFASTIAKQFNSTVHKEYLKNQKKETTLRKIGKALTQFNEINDIKVPKASWDRRGAH